MSSAAQARELTATEHTALAQEVAEFDAAMNANDMSKAVDVLPPRFIALIARMSGIDPATLRQSMTEQSVKALKVVKLVSFSMDLTNAKFLELPNGEPYVLIPTETVIDAGRGKMQSVSDTLALLDNGRWYLAKLDQPVQIQVMIQAYPEFASLTFGGGTTKAVP